MVLNARTLLGIALCCVGTYPLIRYLSMSMKPEDVQLNTSVADFDGDVDEFQASLVVNRLLEQHRVVVFSKVS